MPLGQLYINGNDAYSRWGASLDSKALSALMTPAGKKDNIKISSRLENGCRVIKTNVKVKERTMTFIIQIVAKNQNEFLTRYNSFCSEVLAAGFFDLSTSFQPNVVYHLEYNECTQFSEFVMGIGKFTLKCTEYNPSNRV